MAASPASVGKGTGDTVVEMDLTPVPDSPGTYSGVRQADEDGTYVLRTKAHDAKISNRVEFEVATVALEDRETAMQAEVVRELAELSGGKAINLEDLGSLPASLGKREELSTTIRKEMDLWDTPALFVLLVIFAGIEWYMRRRDNLV